MRHRKIGLKKKQHQTGTVVREKSRKALIEVRGMTEKKVIDDKAYPYNIACVYGFMVLYGFKCHKNQ